MFKMTYSFRKLICWLCLTINIFTDGLKGENIITIYEHPGPSGKFTDISVSHCTNIPTDFTNQVSALDLKNHCVNLYNGPNCTGNSIEILPNYPHRRNLLHWDFEDTSVQSAGPCKNECSEEVIGKYDDDIIVVQIFNGTDFKGESSTLNGVGCLQVPSNFVLNVKSIKTYETCIQLYKNEHCIVGNIKQSIELRTNSRWHNDLNEWAFPLVKSLSHCKYKCDNSTHTRTNQMWEQNRKDEILLFEDKNFKGTSKWVKVNNCKNLESDWVVKANSVIVRNTTCFYNHPNCMGDYIVVLSVNENLRTNDDDRIGSLKFCPEEIVATDSTRKTKLDSSQSTFSPTFIAITVMISIATIIIVLVVILFIGRKLGFLNLSGKIKINEKDVQDFLNGFSTQERRPQNSEGDTEEQSVELLAQSQPYDRSVEISRSQILFDSMVPLGIGEYGVVYKGTVFKNDNTTNIPNPNERNRRIEVAIKTVKSTMGVVALQSLLMEVKVMLFVGNHPNIVRLIGCHTGNLFKGEILVLLEFCKGGCLKTFLNQNRSRYTNLVSLGTVNSQQLTRNNMIENNSGQDFNTFQIIKWAVDIALGMEFLSNAKVIHSDLAARNVLLDENLQAKISDFGLSRRLRNYTEYVKENNDPLPWRWMALESLTFREFSTKSDVWGFAVLAWEMFTLGEAPYPGDIWNETFVSNLRDGMRLLKPRNAPEEIYRLMIRCWNTDPLRRPSFTEIFDELQEILVFYGTHNAS